MSCAAPFAWQPGSQTAVPNTCPSSGRVPCWRHRRLSGLAGDSDQGRQWLSRSEHAQTATGVYPAHADYLCRISI